MVLAHQHTVGSTVLVSHPAPSELGWLQKMTNSKYDSREDSAICMPSAKKSTACFTPAKNMGDLNESLERWVDELVKQLDQVMRKNLDLSPDQDANDRVDELIKKLDGRLSQTADDIASIQKFVLDSIDADRTSKACNTDSSTIEVLLERGLSDSSAQKPKTSTLDDIQTSAGLQKSVARLARFLKNAAVSAKGTAKQKDQGKKVEPSPKDRPTLKDKGKKVEPSPKERFGFKRPVLLQNNVVGRIKRKSKYEQVINGRFHFNKRDLIGEGHHGSVMRGRDLKTNGAIAVKCLKKQYKCSVGGFQIADKQQRKKNQDIMHEGLMMMKLEGIPQLVPLLDFCETHKKVYYVMPLANKDLSDVIYRSRMTEQCAREILKPIFEAVKAMHDSGYVHRDIKPENIMLYEGGFAKLGDFGLSTEFGYHSGLQLVGTPAFAAPEVLGQFRRTEKLAWLNYKRADLWSLGSTLYVCLAGRYPFDDKRPVPEQMAVGLQFPEKRFRNYSPHAEDLTRKLMNVDPTKRITIDEALRHPFFAE